MSPLLVVLLCSVISTRGDEVTKPVELLQELKDGIVNLTDDLVWILYKNSLPNTNIVVSPVNIFGAFSTLLYGADGATKEEIANFLGFPKADEKFIAAHKNLGEFLKSLEIKKTGVCDVPDSKKENETDCIYEDVSIANGVFLDKGYPLVPSYAQGLQSHYSGAVENVDFANQPVEATNTINKWVADKTHNLIPDLLKKPVDPLTRIIIAATIYFSAKWDWHTFEPSRSPPEAFTMDTGDKVKVEYMHKVKEVPYYEGHAFTAISLPYRGKDFEALFVLPKSNVSTTQFMNKFSKSVVNTILKESKHQEVHYVIPQIETECNHDLVDTLKSLNLTGIFEKVNLTKLISQEKGPLQVSKVSHSTKLKVDEKGTVAAGATTFEISSRSGRVGPPPIEFIVDRPFLLIIYHKKSFVPLFSSLIRNPTD